MEVKALLPLSLMTVFCFCMVLVSATLKFQSCNSNCTNDCCHVSLYMGVVQFGPNDDGCGRIHSSDRIFMWSTSFPFQSVSDTETRPTEDFLD